MVGLSSQLFQLLILLLGPFTALDGRMQKVAPHQAAVDSRPPPIKLKHNWKECCGCGEDAWCAELTSWEDIFNQSTKCASSIFPYCTSMSVDFLEWVWGNDGGGGVHWHVSEIKLWSTPLFRIRRRTYLMLSISAFRAFKRLLISSNSLSSTTFFFFSYSMEILKGGKKTSLIQKECRDAAKWA